MRCRINRCIAHRARKRKHVTLKPALYRNFGELFIAKSRSFTCASRSCVRYHVVCAFAKELKAPVINTTIVSNKITSTLSMWYVQILCNIVVDGLRYVARLFAPCFGTAQRPRRFDILLVFAIDVRVRAQETDDKSSSSTGARQLLGMKGAGDETNIWKIRLQLTKPVTWVPLIWGMLFSAVRVLCFEPDCSQDKSSRWTSMQ